MKKIVTLCLALILGLLLVACNTPPENVIPPENETSPENVTPPENETTPKPELSRGTVENGVYQNEFLGVSFNKPELWVYSTEEEIAALMNLVADKLLNENLKETLENNPVIIDMVVIDPVSRSNLNITYENLAKSLATNITVEQYIEVFKQRMSGTVGMTVTFTGEPETVKLGNVEFTRLLCNTTTNGVQMKQAVYLRKIDTYMISVSVTVVSGYTVAEIEAMFE